MRGARWRDKEGDGKCGTEIIKRYGKKSRRGGEREREREREREKEEITDGVI